MAKQIKAIQCPKCGSINKTEIKPDYYKCDSCSTEYFLDNDDINVNYNYNTQKPQLQPFNRKSLLMFIGIVMAFVIGINVLSAIIGFFHIKTLHHLNMVLTVLQVLKRNRDMNLVMNRLLVLKTHKTKLLLD